MASLANKAGSFTSRPRPASRRRWAASRRSRANGAQSLINTSSAAGYPIINYEYAVVDKHQGSAAEATAVKAFLNWIITTGDAHDYLSTVGFEPLPSGTASVSTSLINSISG